MLSDPEKRRAYDARGFAGVAGFSEEELFRTIDFGDLFGGLNFDFGFGPGRGGLFERFFGRRRAGPAAGRNIEVEVEVPLSRVVTGGEEKVQYRRAATCEACHGSGAKDGTKWHRCEGCAGTGRKTEESRRREKLGVVVVQNIMICTKCGGRGEIIDEVCAKCSGSGRVEQEETLTVNVPVGVEDGMVLRVPAHGMPSAGTGGAPGDLFVIVRSAPDPRFERRGADLWRTEPVAIADAVLGTKRTVPTLDGSVDVKIPAGTQPGVVLRLAGKGLPEFGGASRGDLYIVADVQVPRRLTKKQRELYEELRQLEAK